MTMNLSKICFFLGAGWITTMIAGCASEEPRSVAQILKHAPDWLSVQPDSDSSKRRLARALFPILERDLSEVRAGVQEYLDQFPLGNRTLEESKIFVLNRMYFNVPDSEPLHAARFFGGWGGVPFEAERVNMMWPVHVAPDGGLTIVGTYAGYRGDVYRALEEFDFFAERYGKRRPKGA